MRNVFGQFLVVLFVTLLFNSVSSAQNVVAPDTGGAAQPTAAVTSAPTQAEYPRSPVGFYRGNRPPEQNLLVPNVVGGYLSMLRYVVIVGLFFFLAWSATWVDEDANSLKVGSEFWNTLIFGCGVAGMLIAICMPMFVIGFGVLLVAQGLPLGLYIRERNSMVPESAKVMTRAHIQRFIIRKLALIGIHIGGKKIVDAAIGPDIQFIGRSDHTGAGGAARAKQAEKSKGFMAAKELVYDALMRRCTDIHLEPKDLELTVRMRIDGVMYPTEPFDVALGNAVVNIFKVLSAMDITEKRKSLDGSFRAICEGREIDFRVATQGTRQGEKLVMRILDQENSVSTLTALGFRKQLQEQLVDVINQPHGLMLVCGPTGSGKSTTLFCGLGEIDSYQRNIITIEDPVEYKIDNVTQIEINTKAGQTFGTSLRSVLRQDPDVVMIGEIRDGETANIACQAANTGHMVFSTIHANDSITALYRALDLGVEPFQLASSLSCILAQRLARRLCRDCKEAYKPKPEFLKKANLPADKVAKLYRPPNAAEETCPSCGGLGYKGRVGVYELLIINDRMRDLIRDKAALSAIKAEARKNGMLYMKEEGLRLAVKGTTSVDELLRVVK